MHREIVAKQTKQIFIIPTTLTIVTHVACGQPTKCLHCLLELSTIEAAAFRIDSIYAGVAPKPVFFLRDRAFVIPERLLKLPDDSSCGTERLRIDEFFRPEVLELDYVARFEM